MTPAAISEALAALPASMARRLKFLTSGDVRGCLVVVAIVFI